MSERYIVYLEGNHHYMLLDTVTGYSYYTPGQQDATSICNMLNNKDEMLEKQKHHIKELEHTLKKNNLTFEPNRNCENCKYFCSNYGLNDEGFCDLKDISTCVSDYCNSWVLML